MDNNTKTVLRRLIRDKTFIACSLVALLGMICLVGFVWYESNTREADQRIARQNTYEIRLYICTQIENLKEVHRATLRENIQEQEDFLKKHPQGIPGINRELFEQAIKRNQRRINEFSPLKVGCKKFAETGTIQP